MNDPIEEADAYLKLGLEEDAKRCVAGIGPNDPNFNEVWSILQRASNNQNRAEQRELAESGLALLQRRGFDAYVAEWAAECLYDAGQPESAFQLIAKHALKVKWPVQLRYGMATYATATGRWIEAAWFLQSCVRHGGDPHMFFDFDFEPLFKHVATHEPDRLTALALAHPCVEAELNKFAGKCREIDSTMMRLLPPHIRNYLQFPLTGGLRILSASAPLEVREEFERWCQATGRHIEGLARKAIAASRKKVLASQLPWAEAAARRGDFLAARWHTTFALAAEPGWIDTFSKRLGNLGCGYFLDDLSVGLRADEGFARLVLSKGVQRLPENFSEMVCCRIEQLAPETGFALVARRECHPFNRRSQQEVLAMNFQLMNRWPQDPAAFCNALDHLCDLKNWDAADMVLRRSPRSLMALCRTRKIVEQIQKREVMVIIPWEERFFYGQPDLGGLVRSGKPSYHAGCRVLQIARRESSAVVHHPKAAQSQCR